MENQIEPKSNKGISYGLLLIMTISLIFFGWKGFDRGSWEGLIYILALPVFIVLGVAGLSKYLWYRKQKGRHSILSILLLIFSIGFVTYVPAVKLSMVFGKVLHYSEYRDQKRSQAFSLTSAIEYLKNGFDEAFKNPQTVQDIEKDRIFVKNEYGSFVLWVTNASDSNLLSNPDSFRNKNVSFELDIPYLEKNKFNRPQSLEGAALIQRNADEKFLMEYRAYISKYPDGWTSHDWYMGVSNELSMQTDIPVLIVTQ